MARFPKATTAREQAQGTSTVVQQIAIMEEIFKCQTKHVNLVT